MTDGFPNKPKILKGALFEYGISLPPPIVVFQFNPEEITRTRSLSYGVPGQDVRNTGTKPGQTGQAQATSQGQTLREFHRREFEGDDLLAIQSQQLVDIEEEKFTFDIRLDATDDLNDGDAVTELFGLYPKLAALELMVHPKNESILGGLVDLIPGLGGDGFSFAKNANPPMTLFIWGRQRILPVNIESLSITETEFNQHLDPIRATASITLRVIEGKNIPYQASKLIKEAMGAVNLANIADVAQVVVPG